VNPNLNSTANNAPWIPTEVIANEALNELGKYLNLGATVTKDSELVATQVGDTINVPKYGVIVSNDLAENGEVQVQRPNGDTVPIVLDKHKEVTIGELDFARSIQKGSVLPGYITQGLMRLGEDIEDALARLWAEFPTTMDYATSALATLRKARTKMIRNNVPRNERIHGYFAPEFIEALLAEEAFTDPKLIPNQDALTEGTVGRAARIDLFEGQAVVKSGSPGVYRNMVYTKQAMVLASRPQPTDGNGLGAQQTAVVDPNSGLAIRATRSYDSKKLGVIVTLDVVFGVGMLDERQCVQVDYNA
jgi:hypothetical protein